VKEKEDLGGEVDDGAVIVLSGGIVDEDVNFTKLFDRRIDHFLAVLLLHEIAYGERKRKEMRKRERE